MSEINVVMVEPNKKAYGIVLENCLESFESVVDGDISVVRMAREYVMICNEEAVGLFNREVMEVPIYGPFFLVRMNESEQTLNGLSEGEVEDFSNLFSSNVIPKEKLAIELLKNYQQIESC